MSIKKVKISELQPSDVPKRKTLDYYFKLSLEQLKKLDHKPQVWVTDLGLVISDGNNYVFESVRRGLEEVDVELHSGDNNYGFPTDETLNDAILLNNIAIKSSYDFFKLFPKDYRDVSSLAYYAS